MKFNSLTNFKDAIIEGSILNGIEIIFDKNESNEIEVECKGKCEFFAQCSKVGSRLTFQIKTWVWWLWKMIMFDVKYNLLYF